MERQKKQLGKLGLGFAVGGLVGMLVGVPLLSSAQEDTTTTTTVAGSQAEKQPGDWIRETLQPLVEAGTITQAQADSVVEALIAAKPEHWRHGGPGHHGFKLFGLDTAAEAIGITAEELATALRDGSSLAEVATSKGVEPQAVIDALAAELKTKLGEAVTSGRITQAQADEKAANATAWITEMVNGTLPQRFGRHHLWGGFGSGWGLFDAPAPAGAVTTNTV